MDLVIGLSNNIRLVIIVNLGITTIAIRFTLPLEDLFIAARAPLRNA